MKSDKFAVLYSTGEMAQDEARGKNRPSSCALHLTASTQRRLNRHFTYATNYLVFTVEETENIFEYIQNIHKIEHTNLKLLKLYNNTIIKV